MITVFHPHTKAQNHNFIHPPSAAAGTRLHNGWSATARKNQFTIMRNPMCESTQTDQSFQVGTKL